MYLITHSLLNAWQYAMNDNPYADATNEPDSPFEEFMQTLRREPSRPSEAMQNGIDFEDLVMAIGEGRETAALHKPDRNTGELEVYEYPTAGHPWFSAASKVWSMIAGGQYQFKATKPAEIAGERFLLYGRLDVLRAGEIMDIKFSKGYERGRFREFTQHPFYFELIPEADVFRYIVTNGSEVWTEEYRRDESPNIRYEISDFYMWLNGTDLIETYEQFWRAKE